MTAKIIHFPPAVILRQVRDLRRNIAVGRKIRQQLFQAIPQARELQERLNLGHAIAAAIKSINGDSPK